MDLASRPIPTYAAAFRCIGSRCEDPCCSGWDIPVDKGTYARLRQLPSENLGSLISHFVVLNPSATHENLYAKILPTPTGECPFWDADRLCGIHRNYGADFLPATCSIYPRALRLVDETLEGSLSLSCPEAARNVLLNPDFMHIKGDLFSGEFRTDNFFHLGTNSQAMELQQYFRAIRDVLIEITVDRSRPLWLRLLRIGAFCADLQQTAPEEIPRLLESVSNSQTDLAHLETIPADPKQKLATVLALSQERLSDPGSGRRLHETFWDFIEGIASPDTTLPQDDIQKFVHAEDTYYGPIISNSPFMLENYLINYMYQNLFPFGREGASNRSIFNEYLLMTTQFAWINTLLIGIAGKYREAFAGEHVVRTVQSFTRAVEHYPDVLNQIPEYLKTHNLATLEGMAILLKT